VSALDCRVVSGAVWDDVVALMDHDVYHLPSYCQSSAHGDGESAIAVLVNDGTTKLLLPLIKRPLDEAHWDAVSPYGYGGPITTRRAPHSGSDFLLTAALDHLRNLGCISIFLRFHPGLNADWPQHLRPTPDVTSSSETVVLPIQVSEADALSAMRKGHRYQIRLAMRSGYRVLQDVNGIYRQRFGDLYRNNMTELGAAEYYQFDNEYFDALLDGDDHAASLWVALNGDELGAAAIFTVVGDWAQYHLAASDPAHRKFSPAKLLIHVVRTELYDSGVRWLHLGGGVGGADDSLFAFKSGFGGHQLVYRTAGLVLNREMYDSLCHARQVDNVNTRFFPAYRSA